MVRVSPAPPIGLMLRDWRQRRRMSQLDLASEAEVSARHLSFVETGRARPSREFVLHVAGHLEVPLRERNALLLAAGYAPIYQQHDFDSPELAPARLAVEKILGGHEPFPAVAVNQRWDLVAANRPAFAILTEGVAPELLAQPVNALRVSLHPSGLAPRIVNFAEYSAHLLSRLQRQAVLSGDPALTALHEELASFPGVTEAAAEPEPASALFVPLVLKAPGDGEWTFFSTITSFGTALDITLSELSVESFFPANEETAAALRQRADAAPVT